MESVVPSSKRRLEMIGQPELRGALANKEQEKDTVVGDK